MAFAGKLSAVGASLRPTDPAESAVERQSSLTERRRGLEKRRGLAKGDWNCRQRSLVRESRVERSRPTFDMKKQDGETADERATFCGNSRGTPTLPV